jgi:hypothetical protein
MSDSIKMYATKYNNEWVNWIEEAIDKEHIEYYEYNEFSNIQEIGTGSFAKMYRANWRNLKEYFALKSFFNLDKVTLKEIVHEVILDKSIFFFISIAFI